MDLIVTRALYKLTSSRPNVQVMFVKMALILSWTCAGRVLSKESTKRSAGKEEFNNVLQHCTGERVPFQWPDILVCLASISH